MECERILSSLGMVHGGIWKTYQLYIGNHGGGGICIRCVE